MNSSASEATDMDKGTFCAPQEAHRTQEQERRGKEWPMWVGDKPCAEAVCVIINYFHKQCKGMAIVKSLWSAASCSASGCLWETRQDLSVMGRSSVFLPLSAGDGG